MFACCTGAIGVPQSGSRMLDVMDHTRALVSASLPIMDDRAFVRPGILSMDEDEDAVETFEDAVEAFVEEFNNFLSSALAEEVDENLAIDEDQEVLEEGVVCAICYHAVGEGSMVYALSCSHRFHNECLSKWVPRKQACPLCRGSVRTKRVT